MFLTTIYGVIGDAYYAHQIVKSIFPNKVLFQRRENIVIALSEEPPIKDCFDKNVRVGKEKKVDFSSFEENEELIFSLVVNPTKRCNGKRVPVTDFNNWLERKTQESFEIISKNVDDLGIVKSKKGTISHKLYKIDGVIKIKSKEKFLELLCNGVGSSKGFGFGMLNVF